MLEAAEANLRRSHPGLTRITPAGDFRRGCELVSGLSLVAEVPKLDGGKTIRVSEQLTVHLVEKSRFGITLLLATGSAQHVDGLRAFALFAQRFSQQIEVADTQTILTAWAVV